MASVEDLQGYRLAAGHSSSQSSLFCLFSLQYFPNLRQVKISLSLNGDPKKNFFFPRKRHQLFLKYG